MKQVSQTTQFGRDIKRMRKRGKQLHAKHRDHSLSGPWKPARDCHIEPDWILISSADDASLRLERTATHAYVFQQ